MASTDPAATTSRHNTTVRGIADAWPAWRVIVTLDCSACASWELDAYVPALKRLAPEFCDVRDAFLVLCWTLHAPTAEGAANLTMKQVRGAAYGLPIDLVEVGAPGAHQPRLVLSGSEAVDPGPEWPTAA